MKAVESSYRAAYISDTRVSYPHYSNTPIKKKKKNSHENCFSLKTLREAWTVMCVSCAAESSIMNSKVQKWWKSTITRSFISVSSEVNRALPAFCISDIVSVVRSHGQCSESKSKFVFTVCGGEMRGCVGETASTAIRHRPHKHSRTAPGWWGCWLQWTDPSDLQCHLWEATPTVTWREK